MRNNKKGFTIVELVIVIAVIAILAAVLIPTFSSVTNSARASAAQQQAKAGLDSIIALTEGSLPDGTLFLVTNNTDTGELNYGFRYTGNKLTQVDLKKADEEHPIETYGGAENTYAVYVTAAAFNNNDEGHEKKLAAVQKLLLNAIKTIPEYSDAGAVTIDTSGSKDYYTLKITHTVASGAENVSAPISGTEVRVYYTTDIQETMVVFVGNESN